MVKFFKVLWIWIKSFFLNEKKIANKLTDSAFKIFPYPIDKIFDKDSSRIYTFKMPNNWELMGSLSAGEMKLLMQNGKEQSNRTLKISEWSNKTTLFGVINSMQVSLTDKIKKTSGMKLFISKRVTVKIDHEFKKDAHGRYSFYLFSFNWWDCRNQMPYVPVRSLCITFINLNMLILIEG